MSARTILRNKPKTGQIFINEDLTSSQQKKAYEIRREFKSRLAAGEKIKLKYLKGMPKIVNVIPPQPKNV